MTLRWYVGVLLSLYSLQLATKLPHWKYLNTCQGLIVSKCSKVGVKMWFKWTKYSDQTNFEPNVLYERNQGHWNIWVLLPFLDTNIGTLRWWKYIKYIVIMWLAWQTWLIQPGKFNIQLQSPSWNYDPNIRMRLDPKKMVQHQITPQILVLHIRVKKWFKSTHIMASYDWYNTFGVIFRFKPKYLVQTWMWTLWYNQAL